MRFLAKVCFGIACITFWFGGGLVSIFFKIDRVSGEFIGIGIAMIFGVLGGFAFNAAEDAELPPSDPGTKQTL